MPDDSRNHAKDVIGLLKAWMLSDQHKDNPYPAEQEKLELMEATGLDRKQLCNWFVNARKIIMGGKQRSITKANAKNTPAQKGRDLCIRFFVSLTLGI
jgi:hypothetical protein